MWIEQAICIKLYNLPLTGTEPVYRGRRGLLTFRNTVLLNSSTYDLHIMLPCSVVVFGSSVAAIATRLPLSFASYAVPHIRVTSLTDGSSLFAHA